MAFTSGGVSHPARVEHRCRDLVIKTIDPVTPSFLEPGYAMNRTGIKAHSHSPVRVFSLAGQLAIAHASELIRQGQRSTANPSTAKLPRAGQSFDPWLQL